MVATELIKGCKYLLTDTRMFFFVGKPDARLEEAVVINDKTLEIVYRETIAGKMFEKEAQYYIFDIASGSYNGEDLSMRVDVLTESVIPIEDVVKISSINEIL